jgi:hypothetical protein
LSNFYKLAISVAIFAGLAGGTRACQAAETKIFRDITMTAPRDPASETRGELRTDAQEVVDVLKIGPMVERLRQEKRRGNLDSARLSKPVEQMRLLCLWRILQASQEVRKAVAAIDYDLAESSGTLDRLNARQMMTIDMINTFNFMQSGTLGTIKQAMGLHGVGQAPRQEVGMTAFGTRTVLSVVNLLVPGFYNNRISSEPNALSHFLNASYSPSDANQSYLWKFLNTELPGTQLTRRQILVRHWADFAGLDIGSAITVRRISSDRETDENLFENLRVIKQRLNLLHDLKTHIEEFDGCLYEIHQSITFD